MSQCYICGASMFLMANYGEFHMVCPNRFDGKHPVFETYTSNSTAPFAPPKDTRT